jgi:hypothetical protein
MAIGSISRILSGPCRAFGLAKLFTDYQSLWQPKNPPDAPANVPLPPLEKPTGAVPNRRHGSRALLTRIGPNSAGRRRPGIGSVPDDVYSSLPNTARTMEHARLEAVPKNAPGRSRFNRPGLPGSVFTGISRP